ncbi:hypothetical protein ACLOJK_027911 [Asimina triloba]
MNGNAQPEYAKPQRCAVANTLFETQSQITVSQIANFDGEAERETSRFPLCEYACGVGDGRISGSGDHHLFYKTSRVDHLTLDRAPGRFMEDAYAQKGQSDERRWASTRVHAIQRPRRGASNSHRCPYVSALQNIQSVEISVTVFT